MTSICLDLRPFKFFIIVNMVSNQLIEQEGLDLESCNYFFYQDICHEPFGKRSLYHQLFFVV